MFLEFESLFRAATATAERPDGVAPYPYQRRLAADGLPELLEVPTGLGKTLGVVTAWLYRRRFHPDHVVREGTPGRLVFVLPMRVLVEQTVGVIRSMIDRLGLNVDVPVRVLMGGEPMTGPDDWRLDTGDSVIVGTVDMVVSRCLNRGYGESRYLWPIDFGLLHAGTQFVFDEVQLMGPALATTRQLHGLRAVFGAAAPCSSTWMSATVDHASLVTVDAPQVGATVTLSEDDLGDANLLRRVRAPKLVQELEVGDDRTGAVLAAHIARLHRRGTLTLVIVNTVDRAGDLYHALAKHGCDARLVLLHSRFRPGDRARQVEAATRQVDGDGPGVIVVSTQVVEAGVDVSAAVLVTEVAPWPSLVQRAGRCNRDGATPDATLLWVRVNPERSAPYRSDDIVAATAALEELSGAVADSEQFGRMSVAVTAEIQPVLRRRDLLELFDTLPDVSGNDVDVARFIRDSDDLDVAVAWRAGVADGTMDISMPGRAERCPVPVRAMRDWVKKGGVAYRWSPLDRAWQRCPIDQVRPGAVLLIDATAGGYDPEHGWTPGSKRAVTPVSAAMPAATDAATADDPVSVGADWVLLRDHLDDSRRETEQFFDTVPSPGLTEAQRAACVMAARLHDIGKAHEVFQQSINSVAERAEVRLPDGAVFAKSGLPGARLVHHRPNFRHELVSALCLLGEGAVALEGHEEADLAVYLVAAHHGRVRMGIRSLPGDRGDGTVCALGVFDGEQCPPVVLSDIEIPASALDLGVMTLGGNERGPSWSARALTLRDRDDIGVFRLGFMEAVVRLADWRASASPSVVGIGGH